MSTACGDNEKGQAKRSAGLRHRPPTRPVPSVAPERGAVGGRPALIPPVGYSTRSAYVSGQLPLTCVDADAPSASVAVTSITTGPEYVPSSNSQVSW